MQHSFEEEQISRSSVLPLQRALEPQLLSEWHQSVTLTQLHRLTDSHQPLVTTRVTPHSALMELPLC